VEVIKSKGLQKPIVLLQMLEDGNLLAVDCDTTVRFLDINDFSMLDGFKVNIKHPRYVTRVVTFSRNVEFFATLTTDCKEARLYNANTKKCLTVVDRHHGEVSCVGIDPLSRYMFSCGDDGKTFAIDMKTAKLVFTLPVHVDTINDIVFSENGNWVATASYDRKISLFSLVTMSAKDKLKAHAAPVMKILFLKKNRLFSVDKNSTAIIWDIYTCKVIERLQGIHDDVVSVTTSADDKFLFLGTKLGYIILYDADTYELLSSKYIKIVSPITNLTFDKENNHLIIGTEDGFVMFYDIYEGLDKLKTMLKNKQFTDIEKIGAVNPVLRYTKIFELMLNFWDNTLEKAKIALQNGNQKKAMLLFEHFKTIPSKNTIIKKIFKDYAEFEKFSTFAKKGKLSLAYSLANTYPVYRESKIYKALEDRWKKAFVSAQKCVMESRGTDKAKEILAPYRGITKKTKLIQELLTQSEVYKHFRNYLGQKDFKICFELIKNHPFLKEFPEYTILINYGDSLYIKSQQLVLDGDTHAAIKVLRVLIDFDDFRDEVKELMTEIELKEKFFNAIKEEDIASSYNMMALSDELQDTKDGKKLQSEWNEDLHKATDFAVDGDSDGVEEALKKYLKISSKNAAIATIFGLCYMTQLENAIAQKASQNDIENGIKNYMLNFGDQDQIESFINMFKLEYPESKLNPEFLTKGSVHMWRPSMVVGSILE